LRLYLVQHAEAKSKEEDPSRPLSRRGREDMRKLAKYAEKHLEIQVKQIFHSSKLRAKQTAEILAKHVYPEKGATVAEDLEPLADPKAWENQLGETTEDVMIVGHLPHLSKLASDLLTGDKSKEVVTLRMASVTCLERDENGRWTVRWMITPEMIP